MKYSIWAIAFLFIFSSISIAEVQAEVQAEVGEMVGGFVNDYDNKAFRIFALAEAEAEAQAEGRDLDGVHRTVRQALATAEKIEDPYTKALVLGSIVMVQAMTRAHDMKETMMVILQKALATAEKIEDPEDREWALGFIAKATAEAGY